MVDGDHYFDDHESSLHMEELPGKGHDDERLPGIYPYVNGALEDIKF